MKKINVYIIDSSVLVRQMLAGVVRSMQNAVVQDFSSTGSKEDINSKIRDLQPDVIVLGINSKLSDDTGLFLNIRQTFPSLPVIVVSPRSAEGADVALFALKEGAVEYITKPSKTCNLLLAQRHIEKRLKSALMMIPRLNSDLLTRKSVNRPAAGNMGKMVGSASKQISRNIELVVIGGCTGGVQSLFSLIKGIPADLPVPVVIVQHMPKIYTRVLAAELDEMTPLHVREASMNSLFVPGQVYLAPGGYHASIKNNGTRKQITLHRGPKEHKSRPSIDVLLRSVQHVYDDKVLAVILSGGGLDGLLGTKEIADSGGQVILQDKKTSLLWDLPASIYKHGITSETYGVESLGQEIAKRISNDHDKEISLTKKRFRSIHPFNNSEFTSSGI